MFKMLTRSFLVVMAMLVTGSLFADNYIEIGTGTISTNQPIYSSWNYCWAGQVYPQAALGGAKTITKIAYNCLYGPKTVNNQKFYLKNSTAGEFGHGGYESPETNGYTKVFEGNITFQTGWNEITLTTPFTYDGTNLIVFNENRWGQSYGPSFNSTASTLNNNKTCGNDVAFPANQAGYLNPFPSSLPNIRIYYTSTDPATPDNFIPATATKKVKVDNLFSFTLGANTTVYDLYMSADSAAVATLNASAKVVTDHAATTGVNNYTPTNNLAGRTVYFWKVVAKNSTASTNGPLLKFRTQQIISQFPYSEGFESFTPPAFPGALPISLVIDANYPMEREWSYPTSPYVWNCSFSDSAWGHNSNNRVRADIMGTGEVTNHNLMTPRLYLPANHRVSYWWKNHGIGTHKDGTKNKFATDTTSFEITKDGGLTWTTLVTYTAQTSTNVWAQQNYIDLSAYAGNNVYLRWRYRADVWTTSKYFSMDDLLIEAIPTQAVINLNTTSIAYQPVAVNGKIKKPVIVSNTGVSPLVISSATVNAPFSCNFSKTIAALQSDTAWVYFAPSTATVANANLTFNSNSVSGVNTVTLSGTGVATISSFAEAFDAATTLPSNWSKIKSPTDQFTDVTIQTGGHSSPNQIKMLVANDSISPLMLITPGLDGFAQNKLTFWAYNYSLKDVNLKVGVMDNPYDASSYTEVQNFALPITNASNPWVQYEVTFNAANTKPYVAFKFGHVKGAFVSLRIDDVVWQSSGAVVPNPAALVAPANNSVNSILKPKLSWSAGTGNPTGYKVYFGTTNNPTDLLIDQTTTTYQTTAMLNLNTDYFWKVVPYNSVGEAVNCPVWKFTTLPDPTINLSSGASWTENFDALVQTPDATVPTGWTAQNASTQVMSANWDLMVPADPVNAHSAPNCMNVGPSFYEKDCWLITPPLNLKAGDTYSMSYWFKNATALGDEVEAMEVKIGKETGSVLTNQNAATLTTMLNDHPTIIGNTYENGLKDFTVTEDGKYYIGFHAYSSNTNFILFLDDLTMGKVGINDLLKPVSTGLQQNYPNPFNPETSINFSLKNSQNVNISVHNVKGELVQTLVNGNMTAGNHLVKFNAVNLPSGIYFCKMQTEGFSKVMKMNLLK